MFLAVLFKTEVLQPAQEAVEAREEIVDERTRRVTQRARDGVEARPAVTREVVRDVFVENDVQAMARTLAAGAHHVEYYAITAEEGSASLEPVTLSETRQHITKEVAEVQVGGKSIGSTEL